MKMQVPKVLVDIDLDGDNNNCVVNHNKNIKKSESEGIQNAEIVKNSENSFSVRTAICLFEKNSKNNFYSEKNNVSEKLSRPASKTFADDDDQGKEQVFEIKSKPVAAIKPILKKPDSKTTRKTKLLPNDSLNRKRYVQMKRESVGRGEENDLKMDDDDDGGGGGDQSNSEKENEGIESVDGGHSINDKSVVVVSDEGNKKYTNDSSLHKQIRGSNLTMVTTSEINLTEDEEKQEKNKTKGEDFENVHQQNRIPNPSFLWSKKDGEIYVEKPQMINRLDLPLPVPPENYVPTFFNENEYALYDDVLLPKKTDKGEKKEKFEKINGEDEDENNEYENEETYDDVGEPYWTNNNKNKTNNTYGNEKIIQNDVIEKNKLNKMSVYDNNNKKNGMLYLYDDGEGENYQYISDINEIIKNENELELYQYIENNKEDGNIYEDIQSIKSTTTTTTTTKSINTKDKTKDIYEDINNCYTINTDNNDDFINNCYESVYNGIYSTNHNNNNDNNNESHEGYIKSDLSDTSNNSGKTGSSYEKSNSLYGMSGGNAATAAAGGGGGIRTTTPDHRLSK